MTAYTSSLTESLVTLDSYSAVMPNWLVSTVEAITTDDTLGHAYTAVRSILDTMGSSELGFASLPLLFTFMPSAIDNLLRQVNGHRLSAETLTVADSTRRSATKIYTLAETNVVSEAPTLQQILHRSMSDAIPIGVDSIALLKRFFVRRLNEQAGTDLSISPMLLFPRPNTDTIVRHVTSVRAISDVMGTGGLILPGGNLFPGPNLYPTTQDTLSYIKHLARAYTEGLTTAEVLSRLMRNRRNLVDTNVSTDALVRHLTMLRSVSNTRITADGITRQTAGIRSLSDQTARTGMASPNLAIPQSQFVSAWDSLYVFSFKPRSLTEILTTRDAITLEQLLGAIMGYLWVDARGNAIANLPDWGYVLVEDPVHGNTMNIIEIPTTRIDFTREK